MDVSYTVMDNGYTPNFWQQIYVLQTKNMKTLSRNRRRVMMLVLYPIYFVALLSILKQSAKTQSTGFWGSQPVYDINMFENGNNSVAYSCESTVDITDCSDTMEMFQSKTGFNIVRVKDVVSYWQEHQDRVSGGIEIKSIDITGSSYVIRLENSDLKSAIQYGPYGQVSTEDAKPDDSSLALRAYVFSGFAFMQRALDCSISQFLTGNDACTEIKVAPFPACRFKTYFSSDSSLVSLVPFYMVIAFCNIIIFVVINVVIEKESKMVETLNMHGMSLLVYWASWFVTIGIVGAVSCAACTVLVQVMNLFPNTDGSLIFILFFLYNLTLVPVAFVISTFFQNERIAGLVGGMGSIVVGAPAFALSGLSSAALKNTLAILPPLAMAEALSVVMDRELENDGVTWSNIGEERQGFSFLNGLAFLCFDSVFYLLLAWYLHQVLPNNSGVRKHPLFCFLHQPLEEVIPSPDRPNSLIEPVSSELLAMDPAKTVRIRHLCKNYVSDAGVLVQALDNLSVDMYQGQIFALLGHNGAGKSTAISMLTGLTSSSSGEARILGLDMSTEMDSIRRQIGYVPQHDTLFLALTVDENLAVFAGLKGVSTSDATELLQRLGLEGSRDVVAKSLSGGQKRSLSVAIALIGRPRFLILDEPTAGMDPASRRRVWDVLLEHKSERITLLTTHFLDEADVLGDRIAILAHGRLECMGSSLFLKTHLGIGYHLTAVPATDAHFSQTCFVEFIQARVADCSVAEGQMSVHVTIPMSASETSQGETSAMARLLLDLDSNLQSLGLHAYGISLTTLEEVFVNIASGYTDMSMKERVQQGVRVRAFEESHPTPPLSKQCALVLRSRLLVASRARAFNIAIVFTPVLCVVFSLFLQSLVQSDPLLTKVTPLAYENTFSDTDMWWNGAVASLPICLDDLTNSHTLERQGVSDGALDNALSEQAKYGDDAGSMFGALSLGNATDLQRQCETGTDFSSYNGNWTLHFNQSRVNSLPAFLSFLDGVTLLGEHDAFEATAALLTDDTEQDISVSDVVIALTLTYLIGLSFAAFGVTYAYEVVQDRAEGRHQQLKIMGTHPVAIWGSALLIDFVRWCVPFGLIFAVVAAYQSEMLLSHGALAALVLVVVVVGLQTVLGAYCVGHFIESTETVSTTLSPAILLCTMLLYTVVWTALVSTVGFSDELAPYAALVTVVGGIALPPFLLMSAFSVVIHLSAYGLEYPDPSAYLAWSSDCPYSQHTTCFGVMPIVLSAIISICLSALFLSGVGRRLCNISHNASEIVPSECDVDIPEVFSEKERVNEQFDHCSHTRQAALSDENSDDCLLDGEEGVEEGVDTVLIKGLRKQFSGGKVAVEGLHLGIKKGECFGLLGHNGAGKTSLIGMLTCELEPTAGDAFVNGHSVRSDKEQVLCNTGFCPQFGGTWPTMTLREHLAFYAGLRGFHDDEMESLLDEIETALAIREHSGKLVKELSGGNRRKLSAALALIGGPSIVYLDEPSTGVDASTRRHLWEFIAGNQAGRATVLTTHAMEEAEVLAGRIGIMVSGRLKALGTPQELKSKYGSEWQLDLKLSRPHPEVIEVNEQSSEASKQRISEFLSEHLTEVRLEESFADSMRFLVPAEALVRCQGLGSVFNLVESNKTSLGIQEFSLSQTTLENVFLKVAKEDQERDEQ